MSSRDGSQILVRIDRELVQRVGAQADAMMLGRSKLLHLIIRSGLDALDAEAGAQ